MAAIGRRPSTFLRSAWPWRSLAYLVSGVALGAATVSVFTLLVIGGVVTAVLLVGLLAFPLMMLASIYVARFERWRLRLVEPGSFRTGADRMAADPHRPVPTRTWRERWRWVLTRLREPVTWREFGYAVVSCLALWWIDLAVVVLAFYMPAVFIGAPAYIDDPAAAWPMVLFGFALIPVAAYPVTAWAAARAAMTRAILVPLDAKLGEAVRSRARLVDAFEVERRRIERDLHDGAQQRLVTLSLKLGMARLDLPAGSPAAVQVAEAHELARQALDELRELINGVHPQVLADRGLPAAVEDLASRAPVPVDVDMRLSDRLPRPVELAAYFVVSEALTNVARHSGARRATISGRVESDRFVLEIMDDGSGGADPDRGSGLAGLGDRAAAVDGTLTLVSPAGGPTLIRADLPCGS
ncbi:histidine kinase [Virgisporangium ochraceum]|uniref:histidine kinase n=2 Tax=Virgisporangium ochraceum TaxID=65505 RepID=A0A8J4A5S7_9ACTN|nr:histidine kinase [Virgisporangium ochraceum]